MVIPNAKIRADEGPYRVMVVDDSAVIRGIITRWLEADPDMSVVATCANGAQALRVAASKGCEVIVLDIEMPEMDGIAALPQLTRAVPGVQIIMSSTLTRRNAEISMRALAMGAADYVTKPESLRGATTAEDFRHELTEKVKALAAVYRRRHGGHAPAAPVVPAAAPAARPAAPAASGPATALRPFSHEKPAILAIGSSTGGPQALMAVLSQLGSDVTVPIVITQHMPATFTALLAEHLERVTHRPCAEARDGDVVKPGTITVAPGGQHMVLVRDGAQTLHVSLNCDPPENFCRPSVDPLFRSAARLFGSRALGLVLTGMGSDGREGARAIVAAGGSIVAQDEASSVVWGMPGAVATAGLCSAILPLGQIASELKKIISGGSRAA